MFDLTDEPATGGFDNSLTASDENKDMTLDDNPPIVIDENIALDPSNTPPDLRAIRELHQETFMVFLPMRASDSHWILATLALEPSGELPEETGYPTITGPEGKPENYVGEVQVYVSRLGLSPPVSLTLPPKRKQPSGWDSGVHVLVDAMQLCHKCKVAGTSNNTHVVCYVRCWRQAIRWLHAPEDEGKLLRLSSLLSTMEPAMKMPVLVGESDIELNMYLEECDEWRRPGKSWPCTGNAPLRFVEHCARRRTMPRRHFGLN